MATPIVICGRTVQVATGVKAGLQPDFEVIHLTLSPEEGQSQLPYILQSQAPPQELRNVETEVVATANYSRSPFAIVCGRGYDEGEVHSMRDACKDIKNPKPYWLIADLTVETPPMDDRAAYGKHMVDRVRDKLHSLLQKVGESGRGEIVWY